MTHTPNDPFQPSHLAGDGALQPSGTVPGSPNPYGPAGYGPGPYGYGPPQPGRPGTQPFGPVGPPVGAPPQPPNRGLGVLIAVLAVVLIAALAVGTAFAAGALKFPSLTGSTTSPPQDPTVSKPPVPAPVNTDDRLFNTPDRPSVPIPDVKPKGFIDPPPGIGMDRYTMQTLGWKKCTVDQATVECATVAAPLDYAQPDGQAITLSLVKVAATETPVKGTLFVNPGGPGEPGTGLAVNFERKGLEMYDIVGWDPRGTGASTPVVCENGEVVDELLQLDQSPDTDAEKQTLLDGWKQFGMSCLEKSGPLLAHIRTLDTVEDLDLLRQLVGDDQLNFLGYSYGTEIGSVYAEKHPDRVGRLVLDSAVNITYDDSVVQAAGFDLALGNYAQWCADKKCSLGTSKQQVLDEVKNFLAQVDADPIVGDGSRKLNASLATDGIALFLYFDSSVWDRLTNALEAAKTGDGSELLTYADLLRGRENSGQYDTSFFAFPAIVCADYADDGIERSFAQWSLDQQKAPIFGYYFGPDVICVQWPVAATKPFEIRGAGAKPIVVIGSVGDSATPYQYAPWMADQLDSGVLVTYGGNGHATYGSGRSACIDNVVVAYFANDQVPEDGTYCPA